MNIYVQQESPLFKYLLQLGDNALILSQRLSEWTGHGPVLEQDIAMTNMALDILGQARLWYQYASEITDQNVTEDDLAFLRSEREFKNVLLVEQENGDWGQTIVRQYLYDAFQMRLLAALSESKDQTISEIAQKCLKETKYHHRWSSEWIMRLSLGTDHAHQRIQSALDKLWDYHQELVTSSPDDLWAAETSIAPSLAAIKEKYQNDINSVLIAADLNIPPTEPTMFKGKEGVHSEYLGPLLAEMQIMQRSYPGLEW